MKMYKKENCQYKGGYIVCDDEVVNVPNSLVSLLNLIEHDAQYAMFAAKTTVKPTEEPVFEMKSEHYRPKITIAETPKLDEFVENSMQIMDELDLVSKTEELQRYLDTIAEAIRFANEDFIVDCDQHVAIKFDLPTLGDPLKLTPEKLYEIAAAIVEANNV